MRIKLTAQVETFLYGGKDAAS